MFCNSFVAYISYKTIMKNNFYYYYIALISATIFFISGIVFQAFVQFKIDVASEKFENIDGLNSLFNKLTAAEFAYLYDKNYPLLEEVHETRKILIEFSKNGYKSSFLGADFDYDESDVETMKSIKHNVYLYSDLLEKIYSNFNILGTDHTKGLYGKLRIHAHNFENTVNQIDDIELMNHMLMMRRHEKDYMLRGLYKYIEKFDEEALSLKNKLHQRDIKEMQQLEESLTTYVATFHDFFLIASKLGYLDNSGFAKEAKELRIGFNSLKDNGIQHYKHLYMPLEKQSDNIKFFNIFSFFILLIAVLAVRREAAYAEEKNPLTGLNGNRRINAYLEDISKLKTKRAAIYMDLDFFKPFNDKYGFNKGDEVILKFSELLKKVFGLKGHFIGHIGGDDFIVVANRIEYEATVEKITKLQNLFLDYIKKFYSDEEIHNGFTIQKDRFGIERNMPLLTFSSAILCLPSHVQTSGIDEIVTTVNSIKGHAKESGIAGIAIYKPSKNS